jgi:hypothetical protein
MPAADNTLTFSKLMLILLPSWVPGGVPLGSHTSGYNNFSRTNKAYAGVGLA